MDFLMIFIAIVSLAIAIRLYNAAEKEEDFIYKCWFFTLFIVLSLLTMFFTKISFVDKATEHKEQQEYYYNY